MKLTKYLRQSKHDDKRYVLEHRIYTLAYFHKGSVTSCEEIKKTVIKKEKIEKDCDKKDCEKLHFSNKMNVVVM